MRKTCALWLLFVGCKEVEEPPTNTPDETLTGANQCAGTPGGALTPPATEVVDYVEDGGFENAGLAWTFSGDGQGSITSDLAQSGASSFHVIVPPGGNVSLVQTVEFVKGFDYTLGFQIQGSLEGSLLATLDSGAAARPELSLPTAPEIWPDWTAQSITGDISKNQEGGFAVRFDVGGPADLYLDDVTVTADVFQQVAVSTVPAAPLYLLWHIHIENPSQLEDSEEYFRAKAKVFEELAKIFDLHGATLNIQPELPIFTGAATWDPTWAQRLTDGYGVAWSTHTHGPTNPDPTIDDVLAYVDERQQIMEEASAGPVTDHNGNFDQADLGALAELGFATLSACKIAETQRAPEGYYLNPWRPSVAVVGDDEASWAVHDRGGSLVFIPGTGSSVVRVKSQQEGLVERYLTAAMSKVDPGQINAYGFVDHVDHLFSRQGLPVAEYVESQEFQADLYAYEVMFDEVIDPLVASGHVVWASPDEVRVAFEAWEDEVCPRSD